MVPYITARAVAPVIAGLEALGHDTSPLMRQSGFGRAFLRNPEEHLPHTTMMQLWERAAVLSGDDCIGIHVAEAVPVRSFEVHGYALLSSRTLREAYQRACRYQRLIHQVTDLRFEEKKSAGLLKHSMPGGVAVPRQPAEFLATVWVRFGRLITGSEWTPLNVCFPHRKPKSIVEHTRIFGRHLLFACAALELHVENTILDARNPRADEALAVVLDRYAVSLAGESQPAHSLADRVRARISETLKGTAPEAGEIADSLNMSVRTLHRGLKSENVSFGMLLDSLRHERAISLLARESCSIVEVCFLLGFSEISSFYRAFKRWTGQTPSDFRSVALAKKR